LLQLLPVLGSRCRLLLQQLLHLLLQLSNQPLLLLQQLLVLVPLLLLVLQLLLQPMLLRSWQRQRRRHCTLMVITCAC
jgi:hypothetical protein